MMIVTCYCYYYYSNVRAILYKRRIIFLLFAEPRVVSFVAALLASMSAMVPHTVNGAAPHVFERFSRCMLPRVWRHACAAAHFRRHASRRTATHAHSSMAPRTCCHVLWCRELRYRVDIYCRTHLHVATCTLPRISRRTSCTCSHAPRMVSRTTYSRQCHACVTAHICHAHVPCIISTLPPIIRALSPRISLSTRRYASLRCHAMVPLAVGQSRDLLCAATLSPLVLRYGSTRGSTVSSSLRVAASFSMVPCNGVTRGRIFRVVSYRVDTQGLGCYKRTDSSTVFSGSAIVVESSRSATVVEVSRHQIVVEYSRSTVGKSSYSVVRKSCGYPQSRGITVFRLRWIFARFISLIPSSWCSSVD